MDFEEENNRLIGHIKFLGYLKSPELEKALIEAPRHLFVPERLKPFAYKDIPLMIDRGQTISQPSTVVVMTETLEVKRGQKILEIGTGSGWQSALLSKLVGEKGFVYTVEIIPELVKFAKDNLKKLRIKNIKVIKGDGSLGLKKHSPYDRIIVTAACPDIPEPLIEQLKLRGIMVIPVGNVYLQAMFVVRKLKNRIEKRSIGPFMFVPLVGKFGFK